MTAGAAARVLLACGLVAAPSDGLGQGYRFRLDTRFQSVEFRGVSLDSVARSDVVADGDRAPRTADGFAVRCRSGLAYCTYYRPGPAQRGQPLVATGDLVAWGLVPHLSIRASTRVGTDVAEGPGWPGAEFHRNVGP